MLICTLICKQPRVSHQCLGETGIEQYEPYDILHHVFTLCHRYTWEYYSNIYRCVAIGFNRSNSPLVTTLIGFRLVYIFFYSRLLFSVPQINCRLAYFVLGYFHYNAVFLARESKNSPFQCRNSECGSTGSQLPGHFAPVHVRKLSNNLSSKIVV